MIAAQWLGVNAVNRLTAKVYPNPAEDFVSIETVGSMIDLQVNNAFGELVYETKNVVVSCTKSISNLGRRGCTQFLPQPLAARSRV